MDYQKTFISIIITHLPKDVKLVDFISDIIHIGKEASYRRIRCEVEFSLTEVITIAKKLNINLNSIIISEGGNKAVFNLRMLSDEESNERYIRRKKSDLFLLEGFFVGKCIKNSINRTIPDELTYDFPYITKLKFLKYQFGQNQGISTPLSSISIPTSIKKIQEKFIERLSTIRLNYFLDPNLFSPIVTDILFFSRINLISPEEVKELKQELNDILNAINDICSTGRYKGKFIAIYASHVSFSLSHSFLKDDNLKASILELTNDNSLLSFDTVMCQNHENDLKKMKKYTSLITQSGEIERATFINHQRKYIEQL